MNYPRFSLVLFALLILSGCSTRKGVSVYDAPKESPKTQTAEGPFQWVAPESWQPAAPSEMRVASFQTPGGGDVSVVILGGEAGGMAANVNRWRGQIGLPDASPAQIKKSLKTVQTKIGPIRWVSLENPRNPDRAILAALFSYHNSTVFIKDVAPLPALHDQTEAFVAFLKSFQENSTANGGESP